MTSKQAQDNLQIINFRVSPEELARIDRLALKAGISRSQFLRNLIDLGLDESEAMERLGLLRAAITVRDILGWMADKAKFASEDIDKDRPIKA